MKDIKPMLIGEEWVTGSGASFTSRNPATGQVNYHVADATAKEVDKAVSVALRASRDTKWKHMLPHARGRLLAKLADVIEERADILADAQMRENGKVRKECRAQAASAAAIFRYYAAVCETVEDAVTPSRGAYMSMRIHEPYGVIAAITPWNSPLTMEAQKVAPALAAGNAVILKPSEITPSPALELGRAALEAGLPPGILNVLTGTGAGAGAALVKHPGVQFVSFTGGTASGRRIAAMAAEKLMPMALELGGKSPHIVFADADIEAAAGAVADGIFEASGQSCVAGSRLFVERRVHDRVVDIVAARARALKVDLPDAPGAQFGPISSFDHRDRIARMVDSARADGANIVYGGQRPESPKLDNGAFFLPTVVTGLDNSAAIYQQEIFGPVLCTLPFDNEEDLLQQANDSAYGLAAGIWTADYKRAWRLACALEAGTVWINTYKQLSISTPFGGYKDSGIGREKGIGGMRLYQQEKGVYLGMKSQ